MAAEALLGVVFEKSLSLIQKQFSTVSGLGRKIEKLSNTLGLIRAVIEDAEEKQMTNRAIKVWLQRLKDAAYVLDDFLDECDVESHRLVGSSFFNPKNILFRCSVGNKLKEITARLDQIAKDKNDFGLKEGARERPSEVAEWRQTISIIAEPQVYGRDEDKEKIVEFLLSHAPGSDSLSIYPIVGLGGFGKTTLAQFVYNDQRVSNHFNLKIWVCVSENFSIKSILCSIIESVTNKKYKTSDLDVMGRKVQELLQMKRYLLVLDDVWKRNPELEFGLSQDKWSKLKSVLSCGSSGASILVSTRDMEVATIMGTCQAHFLSGLSEDDCWSLFKQHAFGPDKEERADLVAIGKEIVKKCGGSPLAAQALGGLMRSRSGAKEWHEVKESKLWTLLDENDILPTLILSYCYLTPTVKQCFAFCSIFPKDTKIMKDDLIHLWMANGFISSRVNLDLEEVGNMIWNELYQKSFFQDVETSNYGIIYFKMHDLVHDLAQSVSEQECMCLENPHVVDLPKNTHHIGFGYGKQAPFNKATLKKVESLRTLYQFGLHILAVSYGWFLTNSSLRVLCTNSLKLSSLGNLTRLRYLELCDLKIETFPNSICNLQKLEILKLKYLSRLRHLPKQLTRLQHLRHLVIFGCDELYGIFPNIHKLSHLRTLAVYIVSNKTGNSLGELRDLELGGQLTIKGLNNVGSSSEAQEANLKSKEDLWDLSLIWEFHSETKSSVTKAEQVLEALLPHPNLKVLTISWYEGLNFPSWMGNNLVLNNLVVLRFYFCKNCWQHPPFGILPSLRILELYLMDSLNYICDSESYDGAEVRAFPSLEKLIMLGLPNLERLLKVEEKDMFSRLSDLYIQSCPKLQLPCLPYLKNLCVTECNNELLRSISSFNGLYYLSLSIGANVTSFPEGMMSNLTCLKTLAIRQFQKLKQLPYEITKLDALESLSIRDCVELESLPEQDLEGLCSLQILTIESCPRLRSLPEGIQYLPSLEVLHIELCPALQERCKEGTGEDWHKIARVPKVHLFS